MLFFVVKSSFFHFRRLKAESKKEGFFYYFSC